MVVLKAAPKLPRLRMREELLQVLCQLPPFADINHGFVAKAH